jgi:hypothetical protein
LYFIHFFSCFFKRIPLLKLGQRNDVLSLKVANLPHLFINLVYALRQNCARVAKADKKLKCDKKTETKKLSIVKKLIAVTSQLI